MPSGWAETDDGFKGFAGFAVSATLACIRVFAYAVHRGGPCVKAAVFIAVGAGVVIAVTIIYYEIEVLCHPGLVTDFDGLVNSIVTGVYKFTIIYRWVHVIP